ncbi:MAG TPA: bifunctional phosphopantothenoylcysteine decarboxylase/phosphopantothenate--cysteine ligase CoaBC [Chthonomonadaceae bacterium]|nr:bifunctional phosphopantothenoylcysteine decarboxylase/phosphopantothenate--cysteine ligase CoaBC [Chthonomonadaceae bacterium]
MDLAGKQILLGVSGSIAAYKAADLCSQLGKLGAEVHVVLTAHAAQFVGPATFRALTRNPVLTDVFDEPHARRIAHIDLAQSADLVVVAPASADVLAKMAHGLADDMLTTCLLATPAATPVLVAPAMNTVMWEHPATVSNLETLRTRGVQIVQPGYGVLACQDVGYGKLADVPEIVRAVVDRLAQARDLAGRRFLITAGATREPLDPVRFLSNRSSGKMGYAIAAEAEARGAQVTLVSGFATAPAPQGVKIVRVGSADEMLAACAARFPECDAFIAAAAVADYAPQEIAPQKIKKPEEMEGEILTLRLRRTPDILATLAAQKRPGQIVVGFAAETENLLANARKKLEAKRLDLLIANDVTAKGAGFDAETNIVTLLWPDGRAESLPQLPKREVARHLLDAVRPLLSGA